MYNEFIYIGSRNLREKGKENEKKNVFLVWLEREKKEKWKEKKRRQNVLRGWKTKFLLFW